jgi:hypothetical protein
MPLTSSGREVLTMISQGLSKEMKDNGFPQYWDSHWFYNKDGERQFTGDLEYSEDMRSACCVIPTLSELIELCGPNFAALYQASGRYAARGFDSEVARGETPDEAVARLWLLLNNRKA